MITDEMMYGNVIIEKRDSRKKVTLYGENVVFFIWKAAEKGLEK